VRKRRVSRRASDLSSRVHEHPAVSHTCTCRTVRVSHQDRNASSARVREAYGYPRKGALNKRERRDTKQRKKGERIATWPSHGPPRWNPPDPTWPIQGEIYPSALPAMSSIGIFLTTTAYLQGIPTLLFPIPANRPPYVHHPLVRVTYLKLFRETSPCTSQSNRSDFWQCCVQSSVVKVTIDLSRF